MSDPHPLVERASTVFATEDAERRVSLAGEGAEMFLDKYTADAGKGERRHEAACAHIRLTIQEAALFGEPTLSLEAGGALDTDDLEAVNAERRESIEAGIDDLASGRARRHEIARDLGGEPRDEPRYLG